MGVGKFLVPINIVSDNVHAKGARPHRDLFADAAQSHDTDRFGPKFVSGLTFPFAGANCVGVEQKVLLEREQQQKHVLGNRRVIYAGRKQ